MHPTIFVSEYCNGDLFLGEDTQDVNASVQGQPAEQSSCRTFHQLTLHFLLTDIQKKEDVGFTSREKVDHAFVRGLRIIYIV